MGRFDDAGKSYSRRAHVSKRGAVAAGMAVTVEILLTTAVETEVGEVVDEVEVVTEHDVFLLPMTAQVVPPDAHQAHLVGPRVQLVEG